LSRRRFAAAQLFGLESARRGGRRKGECKRSMPALGPDAALRLELHCGAIPAEMLAPLRIPAARFAFENASSAARQQSS